MDQNSYAPIRYRVVVPVRGMTAEQATNRAIAAGIAPTSQEARLLVGIEATRTPWEVVVTFEVTASGAEPTAVEVRSTNGEPVTRAVWDVIRPAAVIQEARDMVQWLNPGSETAKSIASRATPNRAGRPPEYTDEHYRAVALVYTAAEAQGLSPVREVAKAWEGRPHPRRPSELFSGLTGPNDKRARSWVRAARARGFLSDAHDGSDP